MKMIKKTVSMAAVVSATVALAGLAPQEAMAHKKKAKAPSTRTIERQVRAEQREIRSDTARINNLESEVSDLRSQLSAHKAAEADVAAKQQQLEAQVAADEAKENAKNNLIFFRGGYASLTSNRHNELLTSGDSGSAFGAWNPQGGNGNGWYVGAGMDFRATDDLWGLSDMVALDAELKFDYSNFGQSTNALVSSLLGTQVRNQVTMLTVSASPKFKFNLMEGNLRPWVMPFGLAVNVVSPPSSGVTVLNPGLLLGTGIEYRIWQDLWVGTDFRYQFTGGDLSYKTTTANGTVTNQTPTQGLQAGGYIGVGF